MQEILTPDSSVPCVCMAYPGRRWRFLKGRYWLRDIVLSALLVLTLFLFFYQPVQVEGNSMLPLLQDRERIVVNKIVYRVESIRRGDIIVFHYPRDPAQSFIKRVIGLPGDWVSVKDGQVYVNGKRLSESYVLPAYLDAESHSPVHVAPEHYYALGDHRDFSNDSREWGTVARKYIYGKAVLAYWPPNELGLIH